MTGSGKAGNYVGPSTLFNGQGYVTVSGPGVTGGGATTWSLSAANGAYQTTLSSATWFVGPIANNPLAARIGKAGITSTAWSYGVCGGAGVNHSWYGGGLIGVSQTGNALTIANFTLGSSSDSSMPKDQVTFTLVTPAAQ